MPWLVAGIALAVIAVTGAVLLLSSGDDGADDPNRGAYHGDRRGGDRAAAGPRSALEPAEIDVPATAPPSVDGDGNQVTYAATNMFDADPRTTWRMPGDGTGSIITFRFDDAVMVTEVGLINGYAKADPPHDWYAGNRRITAVTWVFDDGTEVSQDFGDDHSAQTVSVPAVETTEVELRILEVTEPGGGPDGRDFTAISDVEISGSE